MIKTVLTEDLFCRDLGYEPCEMILSDFLNLHVPPAHKDTPLNKKNDYFDNSDKLLFCTKFKTLCRGYHKVLQVCFPYPVHSTKNGPPIFNPLEGAITSVHLHPMA